MIPVTIIIIISGKKGMSLFILVLISGAVNMDWLC